MPPLGNTPWLAGETDESAEENCDGQCLSCDHATQGRCVLYVGGRTALVSQYRALAERLGIRLIHHDGGLEEALSRLPLMMTMFADVGRHGVRDRAHPDPDSGDLRGREEILDPTTDITDG